MPVLLELCTLPVAPVPACLSRACPAWWPVACLQVVILVSEVPGELSPETVFLGLMYVSPVSATLSAVQSPTPALDTGRR